MTPLAELLQVEKRYGRVPALRGVSFAVHRGEVHCLLGDNGAGKSTLIKILAGVFPPDQGEYRFEGRTVRLRSPREALDLGIATVFQDLALLPLMSVLRNFILGREPVGRLGVLDLREAERQVRTSLERLGIALDDLHRPVGMLSGGQRQAVAIARAVHFGAKLLILDEPTSALDPVLRERLRLEVRALLKETGVTAIHVTHDPEEAMLLGDRVGVMSKGRLLEVDTPRRLYREPRTLAAFLAFGRANLLPEDGHLLAFRYEEVHLGGPLEALVLERREVRGEVLCRVRLPQGEAWVRLEGSPGERVRLGLAQIRRFPMEELS